MENLKLEKYQVYYKNYTILDSLKVVPLSWRIIACLLVSFSGVREVKVKMVGGLLEKKDIGNRKSLKKQFFLTLLTALSYKELLKINLASLKLLF